MRKISFLNKYNKTQEAGRERERSERERREEERERERKGEKREGRRRSYWVNTLFSF